MGKDIIRGGSTIPIETKGNVSAVTRMEQSRTFMGEDTLALDVQSATPLTFNIGDTIYVHGDPYTLNRLPSVKKESHHHYTYSLELEGAQYGLITAQFLLFDNITDAAVAAPSQHTLEGLMLNSLTGTAADILKMIVLNANRVNGDNTWAVGTYPASTDTLNFTLENGTCLEALQKLCEDWELEFAITIDSTTSKRTITLTQEPTAVPTTPPYSFQYGRTGGLYSIERTSKGDDIITRLYAYGGTQNIPSDYLTKSSTNRLCIRQSDGTRPRHKSYVENAALKSSYGIRESVETFDDIYPQRVGTVTSIYTSGDSPELSFRDTSMFDLNARDSATGATKYLIAGTTAKVTFQTGQMAGYTFDITAYTHSSRKFTIRAFNEEGGLILPSPDNTTLRIKAGDKYILTDINLPDTYVTTAENNLKTKATARLAEINADMYQYSIEVDSRYIKSHATEWGRTADHPFMAGDFVGITDTALGIAVVLRLTAWTHDLLTDTYTLTIQRYQPKVKTSNTSRRRNILDNNERRIERLVENSTTYAAQTAQVTASDAMLEIVGGRGTASSLADRFTTIQTTADDASNSAATTLAELVSARGDRATLTDRLADFTLLDTFNPYKLEIENARGSRASLLLRITDVDDAASSAATRANNAYTLAESKQDVITDLVTIRSNATAGAGAAADAATAKADAATAKTNAATALATANSVNDEVVAARGTYTTIGGRMTALNTMATTASTNARNAINQVGRKIDAALFAPLTIEITETDLQAAEDKERGVYYAYVIDGSIIQEKGELPRIVILTNSGTHITPIGMVYHELGTAGVLLQLSESQRDSIKNDKGAAIFIMK